MNYLRFILFLFLMFLTTKIPAQPCAPYCWKVVAAMPPEEGRATAPGLAGPVTGIMSDKLLVGGGANFPDGLPWEGGVKKYHDEIHLFNLNDKNKIGYYKKASTTMPEPIAYGASIPFKDGIIYIGGENNSGPSSNVYYLKWNKVIDDVVITALPGLPLPLSNAGAAIIHQKIFVAGGETGNGVSNKFFMLDLQHLTKAWVVLPDLPHRASHAVVAGIDEKNNETILMIGGRSETSTGISAFFKTVYAFDIKNNFWQQKADLPFPLAAGTGLLTSPGCLFLFGGDSGFTFNETENLIQQISKEKDQLKKDSLVTIKNKVQASHPGFSKQVLLYHTKTNKWSKAGEIPLTVPVTTTALKWKNNIIIPSGEIKAGVRSPGILVGEKKHGDD